jgi:hypothetical protein
MTLCADCGAQTLVLITGEIEKAKSATFGIMSIVNVGISHRRITTLTRLEIDIAFLRIGVD